MRNALSQLSSVHAKSRRLDAEAAALIALRNSFMHSSIVSVPKDAKSWLKMGHTAMKYVEIVRATTDAELYRTVIRMAVNRVKWSHDP